MNKIVSNNEVERILFTEAQIREGIRKLADKLIADYEGRDLTIIGVLTGSLIFLSDLIRLLPLKIRLDTISASLYGASTIPQKGGAKILKEISLDINDKDVLVVDDIIDTGNTMVKIMENIRDYNPRSLRSCVLLNKQERREKAFEPDYSCFDIGPYFVIGYGLDYSDRYRNLPYIAVLKE
jgi:hypoxanthine phosphoribosyltransferase